MKSQSRNLTIPHLLGHAGTLAFALCGAITLPAEQPTPQPSTSRLVLYAAAPQLEPSTPLPPDPPQGGAQTNAPLKDDLFAGTEKFAKNATEANEVNMDPDSLNLVDGANSGKAHRTLLNVVHHYEYDKPGMYNMAEVDEFRRKLEGPDWHCSVHSRDLKSGESTDICSRLRAPDLIERAIITVEPKELTFIHQIHRRNDQGGGLDLNGIPGFTMVPGMAGLAAGLSAEVNADIIASTAELRATNPLLFQGTRNFSALDPGWPALSGGTFHFTPEQQRQIDQSRSQLYFKLTPEQSKQLEKLQNQLKDMHP